MRDLYISGAMYVLAFASLLSLQGCAPDEKEESLPNNSSEQGVLVVRVDIPTPDFTKILINGYGVQWLHAVLYPVSTSLLCNGLETSPAAMVLPLDPGTYTVSFSNLLAPTSLETVYEGICTIRVVD